MNNSDCAILVPIGTSLEPETEAGLRVLADRGYVVRTLRGTADVVLARCSLATEALRDGFKETMWIDSDIDFIPDDVDRIREQGPFVAGLYLRKKQGAKSFAAKFKDGTTDARFGVGGGLIEMAYVGMGFTYIRAEVYRAIEDNFQMRELKGGYEGKTVIPYFLPAAPHDGDDFCYLAEDYAFSWRAAKSGYPPMADTRIDLGHIGKYIYSLRDHSQPRENDMSEQELMARIGRQAIALEERDANFDKLLSILDGVVSGVIERERVSVDLSQRKCVVIEPIAAVIAE